MILRRLRALSPRERGQALVETAVMLPLFLVLVLGIVDFGHAYQQYITVSGAAREGARLGVTGAPAGAITDRATATARSPAAAREGARLGVTGAPAGAITDRATAAAGDLAVAVQVTNACGAAGTPLVVQVERTYAPVTPLGHFVAGLADGIALRGAADMRLEQTGC